MGHVGHVGPNCKKSFVGEDEAWVTCTRSLASVKAQARAARTWGLRMVCLCACVRARVLAAAFPNKKKAEVGHVGHVGPICKKSFGFRLAFAGVRARWQVPEQATGAMSKPRFTQVGPNCKKKIWMDGAKTWTRLDVRAPPSSGFGEKSFAEQTHMTHMTHLPILEPVIERPLERRKEEVVVEEEDMTKK